MNFLLIRPSEQDIDSIPFKLEFLYATKRIFPECTKAYTFFLEDIEFTGESFDFAFLKIQGNHEYKFFIWNFLSLFFVYQKNTLFFPLEITILPTPSCLNFTIHFPCVSDEIENFSNFLLLLADLPFPLDKMHFECRYNQALELMAVLISFDTSLSQSIIILPDLSLPDLLMPSKEDLFYNEFLIPEGFFETMSSKAQVDPNLPQKLLSLIKKLKQKLESMNSFEKQKQEELENDNNKADINEEEFELLKNENEQIKKEKEKLMQELLQQKKLHLQESESSQAKSNNKLSDKRIEVLQEENEKLKQDLTLKKKELLEMTRQSKAYENQLSMLEKKVESYKKKLSA